MTDNQAGGDSVTMRLMRVWLWGVPVLMLAGAVTFGAIAAADERWGLLAVMVVMGVLAVGLFAFHWWLVHRFKVK